MKSIKPNKMKWEKVGQIFNPLDHKLLNNCKEFAQSPQTLIFDDFIRIYFSTRQKDESNGKYLSHIAYVDFNTSFDKIINISQKPVIALGELGCFDEHGIFPINILKHKDKIFAYTCGWNRRTSVSVDTAVGFATSDDNGETFQKLGKGPILGPSLHEPFLVGDAFVRIFNNTFHMWYMFGKNWKNFDNNSTPDRIYKIGHATSSDGINWIKEDGKQIIDDKLNVDESMALPTVIKIHERYHMYFCYRESSNFRKSNARGYRLGYAYSDDLSNWTRDDENSGIDVSSDGWDSTMMCYPHIFELNSEFYLLYNGNEFGRYGFGIAKLIPN
jgi:hypothetical protein